MKKKISFALSFAVMLICLMVTFSAFANEAENETEKILIDSSNTSVSLSQTCPIYRGDAYEPTATVVYTDDEGNKTTLVKDTDYTVTYLDNVNAGTATVKIDGIGNYEGSIDENFIIRAAWISNTKDFKISLSYPSVKYNGKAQAPKVTIVRTFEGRTTTLTQGKDFNVSVSNNTNCGNATIKITGIGNFYACVTKTFRIIPADVTGFKYTSTANSITLKWNKSNGNITGYHVLYYDRASKQYKTLRVLPANTTSVTLNNARPATGYWYKIRAYKSVGSTNYFGSYSKIITAITQPAKMNIKYAAKNGSNITVNWYATNCTHYQVFYSTDRSFKTNCKIINVKNNTTSYTIRNVNKNSTYYVKVRGVYMLGNERQCGWSSQYLSTDYDYLYEYYTCSYVNNANRTTNLRIASNAINGTIVMPGQTFSFNDVVGPRTAAKGYKPAATFTGANRVENELGGGICQVASTVFNCALYSNVEIVERHQHTQRVSYVPLGRDAAIYGTAQDFKWRNNTGYPIKMVMSVNNGKITCSFYTCADVSPKPVDFKVTQNGKNFTFRRYVNGTVNYTCYSKY